MRYFERNGIYTGYDSLGRFFFSASKPDILPAQEWDNLNVHAVVNNNTVMRVMDGKFTEEYNLLSAEKTSFSEKGAETVYINRESGARVYTKTELDGSLNVAVQNTVIENTGDKTLLLNSLSSAKAVYVGLSCEPWYKNGNDWTVYFCRNIWQGEGQWRKTSLAETGMYAASGHLWAKNSFSVSSRSSWSCGEYYPVLIIENKKNRICWFFEIESGGDWKIECSVYGGTGSGGFNVTMTAADESLGWTYVLKPGEKYAAVPAFYGAVRGDFGDAVREMLRYKRKHSLRKNALPLVFNDYMNCLWGIPDDKKLIPLIDRAAEIGCECFCTDAGWHKDLGNWQWDDAKFGAYGFKGIIEYIRSKGMRAGVWFEFESCSKDFAQKKGLKILERNGVPVSGERPLLDMCDPNVRKYLRDSVAAVYSAGVRFIKNDYNNCTGAGTDIYGTCASEGTRRNHAAFIEFIDSLYKEFPDLIIENCGSGGMRFDYSTLKHFDLQSTSDQENYLDYPAVSAGISALVPTERAGIWAYPYPALYGKEAPETGAAEFSDGEQTVFNIATGFSGNMYLSGRIDRCDEKNLTLIKEGVQTYKKYRDFIFSAYPEYVCPFRKFGDRTYNALGYSDSAKNSMLLILWNMNTENFELDLGKYGFNKAFPVYPADFGSYTYRFENGILSVNCGGKNRARIIRLDK